MTHSILTDPLLTHSADFGRFYPPKQKGMDPQIHASKQLTIEAGDGIRTHDVQLGNRSGRPAEKHRKPWACSSLVRSD